jgi:GTP-binding protein
MTNDAKIKVDVKIFRQEAKFIAGAARPGQLPKISLPQIAFVGKSNVGKSSLINTICRRKQLARVSHTPGRTQQINFFSIGDKISLVDLPGYGFAKVPLREKDNWEKLILYYLHNSPHLKLVNVLIDARRGIKENDLKIIGLLASCEKKIQIVFTKSDKVNVKGGWLVEAQKQLEDLGYSFDIICSSSKDGLGSRELQVSLLKACG